MDSTNTYDESSYDFSEQIESGWDWVGVESA